MSIDARTLPEETVFEHDICIIGAGAAGITLALEFSNQPYQVCLLESGGLEYDRLTQSLYAGENVGFPHFPLDTCRARYLGGSTNLWGGTSRPLDEIDFEHRPWMPYSGWAFDKTQLDPYYERAQKICGLGAYKYEFADWEDELKQLKRLNLPLESDRLITYIFQVMSRSNLRFGEVYRKQIEQSPNITTYLNANVVDIETNDSTQAVTRLRVSTLEGKQFWIAAKVFVLACGGLENPRLLLVSNKAQTNGLGNQHDLVGRFYMEHPYLRSGKLLLNKPNALYPTDQKHKLEVNQSRLMATLALPKAVQEREQVLNFSTRLIPVFPEWLKAFGRIKDGKWQNNPSLIKDLGLVASNFNGAIARAWVKQKYKQPPFPYRLFETHLISEQAPNPDSRVTLSSERDSLGLNRINLDWRLSWIDKYTITRSQQIIGEELERSKLGKLKIEFNGGDRAWESLQERSQQVIDAQAAAFDDSKLKVRLHEDSYWQTLRGSYHHMGTTRMSTNPKFGVVNEDCQVHGIANLYIAGSSVFPTGGISNPTLTIVALAARLADRIKAQMSSTTDVIKFDTNFAQLDITPPLQKAS